MSTADQTASAIHARRWSTHAVALTSRELEAAIGALESNGGQSTRIWARISFCPKIGIVLTNTWRYISNMSRCFKLIN